MKKEELEKEALIALWNRKCRESEDKSSFIMAGSDESPYYILNIEDGIMINIAAAQSTTSESGYEYKIGVVFGEFVEYANFEMDKSEYDNLVDLFMTSYNETINEEMNKIIKNTEQKFFNLISETEA